MPRYPGSTKIAKGITPSRGLKYNNQATLDHCLRLIKGQGGATTYDYLLKHIHHVCLVKSRDETRRGQEGVNRDMLNYLIGRGYLVVVD